MSLNRKQKEVIVAEIREQLKTAQAVVMAEYPGTSVSSFTVFRKQARESKIYAHVIKNRLAKLAVEKTPFEGLSAHMAGPLIYGISSDPVALAKTFNQFAQNNESIQIKTGSILDKLLSAKDIETLASIPSREILLATLLGTMQAPVANVVRTLHEVPNKFVRTLAAIRDMKSADQAC